MSEPELILAIRIGDINALERMSQTDDWNTLVNKPEFNTGICPMTIALSGDHVSSVAFLLDHGAKLPLIRSVPSNQEIKDLIDLILNYGTSYNPKPVYEAIRQLYKLALTSQLDTYYIGIKSALQCCNPNIIQIANLVGGKRKVALLTMFAGSKTPTSQLLPDSITSQLGQFKSAAKTVDSIAESTMQVGAINLAISFIKPIQQFDINHGINYISQIVDIFMNHEIKLPLISKDIIDIANNHAMIFWRLALDSPSQPIETLVANVLSQTYDEVQYDTKDSLAQMVTDDGISTQKCTSCSVS